MDKRTMITILHNGPIYTLDPVLPNVQALAIRDNRILAIGSPGKVLAAAGSRAAMIDLKGRAVIPALTDAHTHLIAYALRRREINLDGVEHYEDALAQIAQAAAALPSAAWLCGGGWDHVRWGGHWPTAHDLDTIVPDRPALLFRKDGHCAWVNSRVLALAGIDATTPEPLGGSIRRDRGEPTGLLFETAIELVQHLVPAPTEADRLQAVRAAIAEAHSYGMAGMHVPPTQEAGNGALTLGCVQQLRERGHLTLRCLLHLDIGTLDQAIGLGLRSGLGDNWLRLGGVKIFADGTLGSETAEMLQPYEGSRNTGLQTYGEIELRDAVAKANANGIAVIVHAIGDGANRRVLDAIAAAQQGRADSAQRPDELGANSTAARSSSPYPLVPNRIEHCQLLDSADIPRFAALGVVASMQPIHCVSDIEVAERLWGERCATAYAWKSLQQSGAVLAFGSDAPVEQLNPWLGIHAAVTRQRPGGFPAGGWHAEQSLSVEAAVRGFTQGAAQAAGVSAELGTLTPGKLADLAVLSADPFRVAPAELHRVRAELTIVDGLVVWEK